MHAATLSILEDVTQLPTCPRCAMEVKLRRFRDRWVPYELNPMNKQFLGDHPALLPFDKDFVFVPHTLCCGAGPCPSDPGLARLWERNRERNDMRVSKHIHPMYGEVIPMDIRDVAARLHMKIVNNRHLSITKSDAVAVLDFMTEKRMPYVGGPELLPEVPEARSGQCVAVSSKTGKRCKQITTSKSGLCYAHASQGGD
jgi:hypothetical protein